VLSGIVAAPRIGVATVVVMLVAGQLAMALLLDHFGWIGLPVREISPMRLTGVALVLVGAFVFTRG
jgi:transporter family-2 protein